MLCDEEPKHRISVRLCSQFRRHGRRPISSPIDIRSLAESPRSAYLLLCRCWRGFPWTRAGRDIPRWYSRCVVPPTPALPKLHTLISVNSQYMSAPLRLATSALQHARVRTMPNLLAPGKAPADYRNACLTNCRSLVARWLFPSLVSVEGWRCRSTNVNKLPGPTKYLHWRSRSSCRARLCSFNFGRFSLDNRPSVGLITSLV